VQPLRDSGASPDINDMGLVAASSDSSDAGVLILVVLGACAVVTVITLVEVLRVPEGTKFASGSKSGWTVAILLTGIFGALLYHMAGKPAQGKQGHRVYCDPRDSVFWCNRCNYWSRDRAQAKLHARLDLTPTERPALASTGASHPRHEGQRASGTTESLSARQHRLCPIFRPPPPLRLFLSLST
jgi:hypothetical protein